MYAGKGSIVFVLGGVRSGKSAFACRAAGAAGLPVVFIATALPVDGEMEARIRRHRDERPKHWGLVEAPYDADEGVIKACRQRSVILWDCITVFVSNLIVAGEEAGTSHERIERDIMHRMEAVLAAVKESDCTLIAVSNEVGLGVVPAYPLGRRFRDTTGRVNQLFAGFSDEVFFMLAGIPLQIKGAGAGFSPDIL